MSRLSRFAVNAAKKAAAKAAARTATTTERAAPSLSVPRTRSKPVVKALPAPPKPLALPAPGPGLPEFAAKPRGGQWWADREFEGSNISPEEAARQGALSLALSRWEPEGEGVTGQIVRETTPVQQWLERALTKYYKNEFGSPDDPLRALAEQGLHYDQDMTPERWQRTVNDYLMEDPIQSILFPPNPQGGMPGAGSDLRGETLAAMPWLAKQPVTDKVYGISGGGLDLGHFNDEFLNALNDAEGAGLPADLAVRPESLARMSFPQAVERVGRINQFRAKEMERAALSNLNSPAIQTFKEYADDNPMGLRWVELRAPEATLPEGASVTSVPGWDGFEIADPRTGVTLSRGATEAEALKLLNRDERTQQLQDALKYEGDTMGHCVGGYCDNVMGGRSRIFSLRDAKGEPHVTIETQPGWQQVKGYTFRDIRDAVGDDQANAWLDEGVHLADMVKSAGLPEKSKVPPDNIIQIKGKQNRAPKDDYLPFVQDFVKSQQWGNVGDLRNTNLVRLPDGRYLDNSVVKARLEQRAKDRGNYNPEYWERERNAYHNGLDPDQWDQLKEYFEGYAIGGRVDADRCFCRHPMSVRKNK